MTEVRALSGLRVADISEGLAGPFAAKLLGDLGADVIKLEPPAGDAARRRGPFADADDPEASAPFLYANTSKRSAVLGDGDEALRDRILAGADVIVAGEPEPRLARRGIGYERLAAANPGAVLVTVTGFGSDGPLADWRWTHLTACATGGFSHLCGRPEREPLQLGGSVPETLAGAYAAVAALIAVRARQRTGRGDHVDVSVMEAAINMALLVTQRYDYTGDLGVRRADIGPAPSFILPTADGWVGANTLTQAQWEVMCQFFDRAELIEDPRFADGWSRMSNSRDVADELARQTRDRSAEDAFHEAQAWRIPFGLVPDLSEVLELLPHRERDFLLEFDHPRAGRVRMPGVPWMFDDQRELGSRTPLLGEHADEVRNGDPWRGDRRASENPRQRASERPRQRASERPLDGLRVIDLSMFMSGPMTTLMMADAGADVIKVESVQRIDGWRAGGSTDVERFWENAPQFNWVNRNKQGITLNLNDERGADAIREMVADADAIVENYTPRVMGNFGLHWEALREINPDLIMLSMPGFGLTGSWSHYTAFANTTEQMSGLPHLTGYPDDQPIFSGTTGGDPLAGVMGALALLSALERRDRLNAAGEPGGCHIDLSQTETATSFMGDAITAYAISGDDPGRTGNFHPRMAPHGAYRCADGAAPLEERWIAIACPDDDAFAALADELGLADWQNRWAAFEQRDADREALDAAISERAAERELHELARALQAAGVPAGAVMTGLDLLEDPHLRERGFFITQQHAYAGVKRYPRQPYRFRNWANEAVDAPSPTLGRDTREVLLRLTSLTEAEIDRLHEDDVCGEIPLAVRSD